MTLTFTGQQFHLYFYLSVTFRYFFTTLDKPFVGIYAPESHSEVITSTPLAAEQLI